MRRPSADASMDAGQHLRLVLTRIRIFLLQLEACQKLGVVPPQRRRRSSATVYSSRKANAPVFTRKKSDAMSPHATRAGGVEHGGVGVPRKWIMGEAFEKRMPHHDGIRALWETRWKFPCSKSLYPFHDGAYQDFEPIFEQLIQKNINDATSPAYTLSFLPTAVRLTDEAHLAMAQGNHARASSLFLRACALYRIARFPYITASPRVNDTTKWRAWEAQKAAYFAAGQLWEAKLEEARVPLKGAKEGDREGGVPVYVRVPTGRMMRENGLMGGGEGMEVDGMGGEGVGKRPTVVLMTGLDGYRPDNTGRCDEFLKRGWAAVVVEIPGTADCPADPADPESPDRMWTSLLDWMAEDGRFDMSRVMVWGLSCGGYYAVRIAHTHRDRLIGCVAQGAGCHYFFEPEWLDKADGHEYPFRLLPAMAMKHGYATVEEYKAGVQRKFSLLETGVIHRPSTRLLLINGTQDGLMPVEDSMMLFEFGSPKEGRFFTGALHMGYPMANDSVYPWMEQVMASAAV